MKPTTLQDRIRVKTKGKTVERKEFVELAKQTSEGLKKLQRQVQSGS